MKIETGDYSAVEGRVRIDDPTTPSLRSRLRRDEMMNDELLEGRSPHRPRYWRCRSRRSSTLYGSYVYEVVLEGRVSARPNVYTRVGHDKAWPSRGITVRGCTGGMYRDRGQYGVPHSRLWLRDRFGSPALIHERVVGRRGCFTEATILRLE